MAEQTTSSIVIAAEPCGDHGGHRGLRCLPGLGSGREVGRRGRAGPGGRPDKVHFELDASPIKDSYTLSYDWKGDDSVDWTLVEGKMLKAMDGTYELVDRGDGTTEVTYRLAVDVSIPMIGMLKRKAEKVIIDTALKGLKKRVESRG